MVQMIVMDVDGVLTDGKQYIDGQSCVLKTVAFQDLDAIHEWKRKGYALAVITGEKNSFTAWLREELDLPYFIEGCKDKRKAMKEILKEAGLPYSKVCYIGDGRYDVPVMEEVGLAVCPADAIREVREICRYVLRSCGGQGCIAELYSRLDEMENSEREMSLDTVGGRDPAAFLKSRENCLDRKLDGQKFCTDNIIESALRAHRELIIRICEDPAIRADLYRVCGILSDAAVERRKILICGNGGSAADSQHFAAELVARFYHERRAVDAEALSVNTSVMTALGNDYDYDRIFARQVEAKGKEGDILIGISTSGTSENVRRAFHTAKSMGMTTILLSGAGAAEWGGMEDDGVPESGSRPDIREDTDELLAIPALDTPRIQEMHILFIHIMCQIIEERIMVDGIL